jgi:hypothetical protein
MFDIILNINNKCINNIVFLNMKKFIIVLFTLYSFNIYSQVEIGVAVAHDIENDIF